MLADLPILCVYLTGLKEDGMVCENVTACPFSSNINFVFKPFYNLSPFVTISLLAGQITSIRGVKYHG